MSGVDDMRDVNQTLWKNTVATFKRQYTILEKLIADAKQTAKDIVDPTKKVDGKAAKRLVEPIKQKLDLLNKYVDSLHSILPSAAVTDDDGIFSVTQLNNVLEGCLDQAKTGNEELMGFLEAIEDWELHQKKDSVDIKIGLTLKTEYSV